MRLSPYQSFYSIVRIFFAIALLQFVAANVEADTLAVSNGLISSNGNIYLNTPFSQKIKIIPVTDLQSQCYFSTYSSMHLAVDNEATFMNSNQSNVMKGVVMSDSQNVVDIDKPNHVIDFCEECKCHGGHIVFTSSLNFVVSLPLSIPANTQNSQYWPPALLVHAKPPIV
ncbi:hypothetical protein [Shewanella surugensis]|uniref:DUF4402 domain-containing protein n=1 Tax=Shewanella surugensis TaxID=212020 RepID=A0ABT0LG58_9GAMM|nr:hypothetical protein [Shewanella surugensis]MCL1126692.1 hypothetical protein [Shewanella surugensis]